jgi:predicted nucleotidyltransferase
MHQTEQELIRAMVDIIVREANPEQIILFGSRARGDARPDSDVDLLIIESEPFSIQRSRRKEAGNLYMKLGKIGISKDLLLYSRDEVKYLADSRNHVVGRAICEGKVIYDRHLDRTKTVAEVGALMEWVEQMGKLQAFAPSPN